MRPSMMIVRDLASLRTTRSPWVVTIGEFDGVHVGHQAILRRLVQRARVEAAAAIIIDTANRSSAMLGCLRQRVALLSAAGGDVLCLPCRLARGRRPAQIVEALPGDRQVHALVVGEVEAADVAALARARGIQVDAVPMVSVDGEPVTSVAVRALLTGGNLARAERMLGRPYAVGGRVVHGLHRGRQLGFPTANMRVRGLQLPPNGVYAVRFCYGAQLYDGVANLGFNPTFADVARSLEVHVFDFDGDLYGRYAEVSFVAHLRDERKFASVAGLIEQIHADCAEARRRLT